MRAGELNRRAALLRRVQVGEGSLGDPIYEWQRCRSLDVALIYKNETEEFAASQRFAVRTVTFRTRYFPDLEATDRIVCEGVTYDVKGQRQMGRRAGLEIAAEARD
jgi:SPP1 family predicted phage head-tail adaptor